MPKVSVVVPVYRTQAYLKRCVESLLAQSYVDWEAVLVDDGSPDQCGKICDLYARQDNRIHVIHQPNRGLSAARNAGIACARGLYIGFLDSDDWLHPDLLALLVGDLESEGVDIASCGLDMVWAEAPVQEQPLFPDPLPPEVMSSEECLRRLLVGRAPGHTAWNKLYRATLFDGIVFPQGRLYEDAFTVYKLIGKSNRVTYRPQPLYYYRQHGKSIMARPFDGRSMDKLDAAEQVKCYMEERFPSLIEQARCFEVISALRIAYDLLEAGAVSYPKEARRVDQILRRKGGFLRYLPCRHRGLRLLYLYFRPLYRMVWRVRLRRKGGVT